MNVGIENVGYHMECDRCNYAWLAVVEASKIEWTEFHVELHHGDELECPECGYYTPINKDDN